MAVSGKSKKELIEENKALRSRLKELEHSESRLRKAGEALRENHKRFRTIIETAKDSIFVKDLTLRYTHVNPAMEKLFGLPAKKLIGCTDDDLFGKEAGEHIRKVDSRVLEGQIVEEEHTKPVEGVPFTFHVIKVPIQDAEGKIVGLCGIARDITERKQMEELLRKAHDELEMKVQERTAELRQANEILKAEITNRKKAEEALRKSEAKYRMLFENTSMPVSFWSLNDGPDDWRVISINAEAARTIGRAPEEVIGKTIDEVFLNSDSAERARKVFKEVLESGKGYESEDGIEVVDGIKKWFRSDIRPVRDENGKVIAIQALSEDITEQKKAQEAVLRERDMAQKYLDVAGVMMMIIDEDRKVKLINKKGCQILGYDEDEIIGKDWFENFLPEHVSKEVKLVEEKLRAGETRDVEYFENPVLTKSGQEKIIAWHNTLLHDEEGRPTAILCSGEDITERKRLEEAYRSLVDNSLQGLAIIQDGRMVFLNKAFSSTTGYSEQELLAASPEQLQLLVHPEDRELVWKRHRDRLAGKSVPPRYDFRWIRKDGSTAWVEIFASEIEYRGRPAVQSAYIDITERKEAEQALKESLQTSDDIVKAIPSGLFIYQYKAPDSLVLLNANPEAERLTGINKSDWIGKEFNEIWPEAQESGITEAFLSPMKTGKIYETEDLRYKDERLEGVFRVRSFRLPADRLAVAFENITEHKKAEQRFLEHRAQLKSLASELSLTEERERHRLATILHDQISQALVISRIKLQALQASVSSAEIAGPLEEVCENLDRIIQDTRTLTFDLSSPILYELGFEAAVSEWLEEQITKKHGIKTEFKDDGRPKPLDDDIRILLFRNVRELLINIVKHARAKNVKVSIRRIRQQIYVCVEDDGIGFDHSELSSSSGFGIFSIRERLEQLAGHIDIESEPGRGSKITMTAPLKCDKISGDKKHKSR